MLKAMEQELRELELIECRLSEIAAAPEGPAHERDCARLAHRQLELLHRTHAHSAS
jgi:hypothetical protein